MTALSQGRSLPAAYGRVQRPLREVVSNRGRFEMMKRRTGISGLGNPPEGKCFHDRNYGGRLSEGREDIPDGSTGSCRRPCVMKI